MKLEKGKRYDPDHEAAMPAMPSDQPQVDQLLGDLRELVKGWRRMETGFSPDLLSAAYKACAEMLKELIDKRESTQALP